jgi:hypothetical protein
MEQTTATTSAVSQDSASPRGKALGLVPDVANSPAQPDPEAPRQETRALLAWMGNEQAMTMLLEGRQQGIFTSALQEKLAEARAALNDRKPGIDQTDLIRPMPRDMASYIARLEKASQAKPYWDEGWRPAMVDLPRVCAFQPHTFTSHAHQRVEKVSLGDVRSLAEITLPLDSTEPVTFQFDRRRQMFVTSVSNANLQVVGAFGGLAPGQPAGTVHMGFQLRMITSYLQVGSMQGRWFLRDGYHRSLGLVQRGVRYVPAFVREDMTLADLVPPGALEFEAILGNRPPLLTDYWDEGVACSLQLPAPRRVISVQASELSIYG